eukprot:9087939-Pyramimonas_sp.AAC.1
MIREERSPEAVVAWQAEHDAVQTLDVQIASEAHLTDGVRAPMVWVIAHDVDTTSPPVPIAAVRPGTVASIRDVVQIQALARRIPLPLLQRTVRVHDPRPIGQNQILSLAQAPPNKRACRKLPAGVRIDRRLIFMIKAEATHHAMLRHVALRELPARWPTPVEVASDDALARVQRETTRPDARLQRRILRKVHGRGAVGARAIWRLPTILRLQSHVRSRQWQPKSRRALRLQILG